MANPPPSPALWTQRHTRRVVLLGLLLVGGAFRFWGITWGAPERYDFYIDEKNYVIRHAMKLSLDNPEPSFLNYPTFLAYSIAIGNGLAERLGWPLERWQVHVLGRSIVALYGTASAALGFLIIEALGVPLVAAALAGLWVALLPDHVWESHVAVTDVMMTFWVMALILTSVRAARNPSVRAFALCGVALGLAVGSKYTAALAAVAPFVALAQARPSRRQLALSVAALTAAALASCFVVTPYSFLRPARLLEALAFEGKHVRGDHPGFSLPAPGWQYHRYVYQLAAAFPFAMGFALYGAGLTGAAWAALRRRREAVIPLATAAAFLAVTGSFRFTPLRYYLPTVVVLAMCAGWWQGTWLASGSRLRVSAALAAVTVVLAYTSVFTYTTTARYSNDTRIAVAKWLETHVRPDLRMLAVGNPSYLALPKKPRFRFDVQPNGRALRLSTLAGYDVVEITSMTYLRGFRQGRPPMIGDYHRLRSGRGGFHMRRRFEASFLNRRLYERLDPMFGAYFVSPTIEIYLADEPANNPAQSAPPPTERRRTRHRHVR